MALSREHHYSLLFCWKLRRGVKLGVEPERMMDYVAYFHKRFLFPHFEEEERVLFKWVKDDAQIAKAIQEHQQIKAMIHSMPAVYDTGKPAAFEQLADAVDAHVRFEERVLFPHLEHILSEDQLKGVEAQLTSPVLKDTYGDPFWSVK